MAEVVANTRTIAVNMTCDKCHSGLMRYDCTAPALMTMPPKLRHECRMCGHEEYYTNAYPYYRMILDEEWRTPTENEMKGILEDERLSEL